MDNTNKLVVYVPPSSSTVNQGAVGGASVSGTVSNNMQSDDFPFIDSPASLTSFNGNPISPISVSSQLHSAQFMSEDDDYDQNLLSPSIPPPLQQQQVQQQVG
jgi:hypothetical protein